MRNISQLAISMMLLAAQAHVPVPGAMAATDEQFQTAKSDFEVRIETNTTAPFALVTQDKPDFDADVLVPLRAAQAKAEADRIAAENAARAKAQAEAATVAAAKAAANAKLASVATALPSGSHTDWMAAAGIAESDYGYVDYIISRESGWGVTKSNYAGSGAYGLGQALPASKMAPFGADYLTNPVTQLKWANAYAKGRYGSWANAYNFWVNRHVW